MIIGLAGYARTGKDTVADILCKHYGYRKKAFADPVREALYVINPIIRNTLRIRDLVDAYGWDMIKGYDEARRLLQVIGTEFGREMIDPDIWIKKAFSDVTPGENLVFSDVRFQSEAREITKNGGVIWNIQRDGVGPANGHKSESDMNNWPFDTIIRNNFSEEELEAMVISTMDWYDVHRNAPTLPA